MKKLQVSVGVLVLAFATSAPVFAQARQSSGAATMTPWTWGGKAGLTLSTLRADNNADVDMIAGADAGVFARSNITDDIGLQVEALVAQRGAGNDAGGSRTLRLTYLDVPVLVRFGNTRVNRVHLHAFTGLTPGFLLHSALSDNASTLTIGVVNDIKTFDLGWVFGGAVEQGPWTFDARYTFGLVDINGLAGGADLKNRSAAFNVGYRFGR